MKKLFLLLTISVSLKAKAQYKEVEGFLGIKFGATKEEVTKAMNARGAIFELSHSDSTDLGWSNVTIANRKADICYIKFIDNKAYEADIMYIPGTESKVLEIYNDIAADLDNVYGKGKSYKHFKAPYKAGDGKELGAIKSGKVDFKSFWEKKNDVMLELIDIPAVQLTYQDVNLIKLVVEKQDRVKKSDY